MVFSFFFPGVIDGHALERRLAHVLREAIDRQPHIEMIATSAGIHPTRVFDLTRGAPGITVAEFANLGEVLGLDVPGVLAELLPRCRRPPESTASASMMGDPPQLLPAVDPGALPTVRLAARRRPPLRCLRDAWVEGPQGGTDCSDRLFQSTRTEGAAAVCLAGSEDPTEVLAGAVAMWRKTDTVGRVLWITRRKQSLSAARDALDRLGVGCADLDDPGSARVLLAASIAIGRRGVGLMPRERDISLVAVDGLDSVQAPGVLLVLRDVRSVMMAFSILEGPPPELRGRHEPVGVEPLRRELDRGGYAPLRLEQASVDVEIDPELRNNLGWLTSDLDQVLTRTSHVDHVLRHVDGGSGRVTFVIAPSRVVAKAIVTAARDRGLLANLAQDEDQLGPGVWVWVRPPGRWQRLPPVDAVVVAGPVQPRALCRGLLVVMRASFGRRSPVLHWCWTAEGLDAAREVLDPLIAATTVQPSNGSIDAP